MRQLQIRHNRKGQLKKKWIIKRRPPRSKIQIYGDLLRILEVEASNKKIFFTSIQRKIDVPFDRLKKYLADLQALALIEDIKTLKVTKKGKQYLQEYEKVTQTMQHMNEIITTLSSESPKKML